MRQSLRNKVIVITGASSGIGRATAEMAAARGAVVVLAARRQHALEEVAEACQGHGGRAVVKATDVADEHQVHDLARHAVGELGRIDAWVNNAAVSLFSRFEEAPPEAFRRVMETNIFGYAHGARAVLPYFREQGRGTLINVSSVVATMSQPYTTAYVMSKQAIRGLSDCLRMELELDEARNIHVCTVLPASIDTPIFQSAANYTGRLTKPMQPVYPAAQVAQTIVGMIRHPRRERFVGSAGRAIALERVVAPGLWEKLGAHMVDRDHFQQRPADPTPGNLFHPVDEHARTSGGWLPADQQRPRSRGRTAIMAAAGLMAPLALLLFKPRPRRKKRIAPDLSGGAARLAGRAAKLALRS